MACIVLKQVPDATVSVESPSLDVKKPKKGFGFGGIFKKPSVKAGLKVCWGCLRAFILHILSVEMRNIPCGKVSSATHGVRG